MVTTEQLVYAGILGCFAFLSWLIKDRFKSLYDIETRMITVEAKLDVMGDINNTLHELRTDVAVIKQRLEQQEKVK